MTKLLNPELYQRLCSVFTRRGVTIHKPGQRGGFGKGRATSGSYRAFRLEKTGQFVGEEFAVACPFCADHKPRLYFNHRWGTVDPYSGQRILWLVHCYNEECQADWQNRLELAKLVFDSSDDVLTLAKVDESAPVKERQVRLPGVLQDIAVLARQDTRHPAVQWCLARHLSVDELSSQYGVGYCVLPATEGSRAASRLVAPFYMRAGNEVKLAGWTARRVHDDPDSPKWLHSASAVGQIVYGLGEAKQHQTLVMVEGPGDKWAVGPAAVAIFGKTLRPEKAKRIATSANPAPTNKVCVILLDPEMDRVQKAKGKPHHSAVAAGYMRKVWRGPVIDVRLPIGSDPGSLCRDYIWDYIKFMAKKSGVTVTQT